MSLTFMELFKELKDTDLEEKALKVASNFAMLVSKEKLDEEKV